MLIYLTSIAICSIIGAYKNKGFKMQDIKFRLIKDGKIVGYEMFHDGRWAYAYPVGNFSLYYGYIDHDKKDQYTGLKDKNGVEIYEGDIVRHTWVNSITSIRTIEHIGGSFIARVNGCASIIEMSLINFHTETSMEVIGNIYENQ